MLTLNYYLVFFLLNLDRLTWWILILNLQLFSVLNDIKQNLIFDFSESDLKHWIDWFWKTVWIRFYCRTFFCKTSFRSLLCWLWTCGSMKPTGKIGSILVHFICFEKWKHHFILHWKKTCRCVACWIMHLHESRLC